MGEQKPESNMNTPCHACQPDSGTKADQGPAYATGIVEGGKVEPALREAHPPPHLHQTAPEGNARRYPSPNSSII